MTRENLDKIIDYLESELSYSKKKIKNKKVFYKLFNKQYYNYIKGIISTIETVLDLINYISENE